MLSSEVKTELMRKIAKWNASQLDVGYRARLKFDFTFNGILEMLHFLDKIDASFENAFKLIDEAENEFRKFYNHRYFYRWDGLRRCIDMLLSCYTTDCVAFRRYNEDKTHFYLLTDGHY